MSIWVNFLIDSLAFGATFMYGSTGEILSEKAGQLNLGIPGVMCMGGAGGCLGMWTFHHKTKHWYFRFGFPLITLGELAGVLWLLFR